MKSLKNRRKDWGFLSARQQNVQPDVIAAHFPTIRNDFPTAGVRTMKDHFRTELGGVRVKTWDGFCLSPLPSLIPPQVYIEGTYEGGGTRRL